MLRQAQADPAADILVGDWLAELTIGWSARQRYVDREGDPNSSPDQYYMKTIIPHFEESIDTIVARKQKLITNAGSLSPKGCALALNEIAQNHRHKVKIAYVTGDDVLERFEELDKDSTFKHFDTGENLRALSHGTWVGANAYIGGWGLSRRSKPEPTSL
jgi:hypothetical protein